MSHPTRWTVALLVLALAACEPSTSSPPPAPAAPTAAAAPVPAAPAPVPAPAVRPTAATLTREQVPQALRACWGCHEEIVRDYFLEHAMARAAGPMGSDPVPPGSVRSASGVEYEISTDAQHGPVLEARLPDGGRRRQRLVGRIGAGRFDVSWAAAEMHPTTGAALNRLYFAPAELVTGHGWALSPFELAPPTEGMDFALTGDCLGCHVGRNLAELPSAQVAAKDGGPSVLYPGNHLGSDAFEHLEGLRCEVCHGDTRKHREAMAGLEDAAPDELAIERFDDMKAAVQRDVCGRCHLQGDARLALVRGPGDRARPLPGQLPTFVPAKAGDDFRFVGQLERLALSRCYTASPELTCNTCHEPHRGVEAQGIPSFDTRCQSCHGAGEKERSQAKSCSRAADLTVESVTGEPARTDAGCVDCHVRRSQPFDLPHVRATDHWIRRRIPRAQMDLPHRDVADAAGELVLFDRERLKPEIDSPAGKRWESGVRAIALLNVGRADEALAAFDGFPAPGTPEARQSAAPAPLEGLESKALFHENRALALLGKGRVDEALAAFGDALAIEPHSPTARMGRARLRLIKSDIEGMLIDTQAVIESYPLAEEPWELRLILAEKVRRSDLAYDALTKAVVARPANASHWYKLGKLEEQRGNREAAKRALDRARTLQPSILEQDAKR
jgi:hypothetical protein